MTTLGSCCTLNYTEQVFSYISSWKNTTLWVTHMNSHYFTWNTTTRYIIFYTSDWKPSMFCNVLQWVPSVGGPVDWQSKKNFKLWVRNIQVFCQMPVQHIHPSKLIELYLETETFCLTPSILFAISVLCKHHPNKCLPLSPQTFLNPQPDIYQGNKRAQVVPVFIHWRPTMVNKQGEWKTNPAVCSQIHPVQYNPQTEAFCCVGLTAGCGGITVPYLHRPVRIKYSSHKKHKKGKRSSECASAKAEQRGKL